MLLSELIQSLQDLSKTVPDLPIDLEIQEPDYRIRLLPPSSTIRVFHAQRRESLLLTFVCKEGSVESNYVYSTNDEENRQWISTTYPDYKLNPYAINRMLWAMSLYDINRWWLNPDPRVRSYYQFREPILIIPFDEYHQGLESLIGRPIDTMEFALNKTVLLRESQSAFDSLGIYNNFRRPLAVNSPKERKKGKLPAFSCPY